MYVALMVATDCISRDDLVVGKCMNLNKFPPLSLFLMCMCMYTHTLSLFTHTHTHTHTHTQYNTYIKCSAVIDGQHPRPLLKRRLHFKHTIQRLSGCWIDRLAMIDS